ncbi:alpha-glucan phosphorylases subfamily [Synechococcus sp. PCC 7335]|uniref:alpha-glucan family phosphorylase n=1 Tax=Synechococcus sp. (strain ATCC 29403 / PCC 7335) TaxID=91464 RepID=UPI00017EBFAF|nr:alpha-glucan family phosphorylase [Synechococcus sp. PCC 7335]EDX83656.1 alpha-glucan phosphorylases subfamily [Synechococcus sp. PCC 7335]
MNEISQLSAKLPDPVRRLADFAYNYWWSWTPERVSLFSSIDPGLWQQCNHNPVALLNKVSHDRLWQIAEDPNYLTRLEKLAAQLDHYLSAEGTWASREVPEVSGDHPVAYLCIEFGVHESLPIYCGGLGVLAGDYLKSASDLGMPAVGMGLLYKQGYFQQKLNRSGWQQANYVDNDIENLPLLAVCNEFGQPITVKVAIGKRSVKARVWKTQLGRSTLYLLDSDLMENDERDRELTGHLYNGNPSIQLGQAMLLGIGGVRALQALGIEPVLYHLNEVHPAFALLEIARQAREETGLEFDELQQAVRDRARFTTHTPVPFGNTFPASNISEALAAYMQNTGVSADQILALGQLGKENDQFSLTRLALRLTQSANGVSERHGHTSRQLWRDLYPQQPVEAVPIGHITNGVHVRSWVAPLIGDLFDKYVGPEWAQSLTRADQWKRVETIPNTQLWHRHSILKARLVAYTRDRILQSRLARGEAQDDINAVARLLDPNVLTVGVARRFSVYKRSDLLFRDLHHLTQIVAHPKRPVQIIFAGKAHPDDDGGKRIIQRIMEWSRHPDLRDRVAFIENYDLYTSKLMVQGVDLWLSTARRTLEASGIGGQKVALNGGLNLGILDGWWYEGYRPGINGWAIGDTAITSLGNTPESDSYAQDAQDARDAEVIYNLLERDIARLYYKRDHSGISPGWLRMMKASISSIAPFFNTDRMVAQYVDQQYFPHTEVKTEPVAALVS